MPIKPANIFIQFVESVQRNSSKEALLFTGPDGTYHSETYLSIYKKSLVLASVLRENGVEAGSRVAVLLENRPEFSWVSFAVFSCGAVLVPMDVQYSSEVLGHLLAHSGAVLIISSERFRALHQEKVKTQWLCIDSEDIRRLIGRGMEAGQDIRNVSQVFNREENAAFFYTSGTTAQPKAVVLTHGNFLSDIESIIKTGLVLENDMVLSVLPLHHTYAFTVTLLLPLLNGLSISYPKSLSSHDLLACIKQTCTTIFVGVPQIFTMIHRSIHDNIEAKGTFPKFAAGIAEKATFVSRRFSPGNAGKFLFRQIHRRFGPSLRLMVSGGARLDPKIAEDFYRWGFTLVEGYGLTETSPVVTFSLPDHPRFGSVGRPLSGIEIGIIEPNERGEGEVAVKGANVMKGYYQMDVETRRVLRDGWFYTGDIGRIDEDGFLFLTGRKKEMLVLSNGENINPEELEAYYGSSPFIKEIAILTAQDSPARSPGETKLVAIIVPDEEYFRSQEELNIYKRMKWEIENYSVKLLTYKRIKGFVLTQESLPRTRLGKLKRFELEKIYEHLKGHNKPGERDSESSFYSDFSSVIFDFIKRYLSRSVSPEDHLELDLGLDSLGRLELLTAAEQNFKLKFSENESAELFRCSTVGQLVIALKIILEKSGQADVVTAVGGPDDNAAKKALSYIENRVGRPVSLNEHLEFDLGFDSLSRLELLLGIQQHLKLELTEEQAISFFLCNRIKDLLAELNKIIGAASISSNSAPVAWHDILTQTPEKKELEDIDINAPGFLMKAFNILVLGFIKMIFKLLFDLKVTGREILPQKGPYVICSNHNSYFDGLIIACALPFQLALQTFFLGDSKFFDHWLLRLFKKTARLISIQFTHHMTRSLRLCAYVLKNGKVLVYFPEGQRSIDGEVKEFRKGIGVLIQELEVTAVPVYIKGSFEVWPRGRRWPRLGKVSVTFGKPVPVQELRFKLNETPDIYQRISDNLRQKVVNLA
ncbi:MAG: AMP-binding protein [Candidatus Omnitrophota bacterium]